MSLARTAKLLRDSPARWRAFAVCAFLLPACVVRLSDRNAPLQNGGVSGGPVDCANVPPLGEGAPSTDPKAVKTKFLGRYDFSVPDRPHFDWSGNSMNARFHGTEVTWGAEAGIEIVFEQIVDGKAAQVILGGLVENKTVTVQVPDGDHEITVVRSSEALFSDGAFIPFTFGAGTTQLAPIERPRRIEYIGDSITCGYGNEGANATCPYDVPIRPELDTNGNPIFNKAGEQQFVKIPESQNIHLAYGSIAARKLAADAVTLCFSGKGVVLNYREQGVGEGKILNPDDAPDPDAKTTIPEYYLRTIATINKPDWDFAKDQPQPQVVVINIGTNDFARDVNQDSIADGIDVAAFRAGYRKFVDFVRSKRPDAHIFLAVPPMVTDKFPLDNARTDFRNTLTSIAQEMNGQGDGKVYSMELVEMGVRYGLGCDYHPNLEVHRIMAEQVVGAIKSKTCWSTVDAQ